MERDLANANHCVNMELGATCVPDTELPNATTLFRTELAISAIAALVACCEVALYEPCECISEGDDGEDISSLEQIYAQKITPTKFVRPTLRLQLQLLASLSSKFDLRPFAFPLSYFTKEFRSQKSLSLGKTLTPARLVPAK